MNDQQLLVAKFTATSYPTRKFKLHQLLIAKELIEFCDGTAEEPGDRESTAVLKTGMQAKRKEDT